MQNAKDTSQSQTGSQPTTRNEQCFSSVNNDIIHGKKVNFNKTVARNGYHSENHNLQGMRLAGELQLQLHKSVGIFLNDHHLIVVTDAKSNTTSPPSALSGLPGITTVAK